MVSISHKQPTSRTATAIQSLIFSSPDTYTALVNATLKKGDAIAVARIAGIMGAKRTGDLIPLAHPGLGITGMNVDIQPFEGHVAEEAVGGEAGGEVGDGHVDLSLQENVSSTSEVSVPRQISKNAPHGGVLITAKVSCEGKTGVEMEALAAANVAGLAMYDMLKGVDKGMSLREGRVVSKSGGKSGSWHWDWNLEKVVRDADSERRR